MATLLAPEPPPAIAQGPFLSQVAALSDPETDGTDQSGWVTL